MIPLVIVQKQDKLILMFRILTQMGELEGRNRQWALQSSDGDSLHGGCRLGL